MLLVRSIRKDCEVGRSGRFCVKGMVWYEFNIVNQSKNLHGRYRAARAAKNDTIVVVRTILAPRYFLHSNNSPMSTDFVDSLHPAHLDQWPPLPSFVPHYCRLVNQRDVTEGGLPLLLIGASCHQCRHFSQNFPPPTQNISANFSSSTEYP